MSHNAGIENALIESNIHDKLKKKTGIENSKYFLQSADN